MRNTYSSNNTSWTAFIVEMILVIAFILIVNSCSISNSRNEKNMVVIKDGYCYDRDTKIIYIESYAGKYGNNTVYTIYYDENGNICKYDVQTGNWIPVTNCY